MNILIDKLPESVTVCGKDCPIRSDFRTWIKVARIMLKGEAKVDDIAEILKLVFLKLPPNLVESMSAIEWFFCPIKGEKSNKTSEKRERIYDFDCDANSIYSAFYQQYGIDLTTANLHWWKFKALLDGLGEDTPFIKTVQFRSINLSDIKDKETKKFYQKMKRLCKLPDVRTAEQKEEAFNKSIAGLF